ncbi:uncharacterized protein LOC122128767 [Clupea harengus]|uniref:Uncharacterized protein LOC122128767 n=1 Tax=Clupea harengus TaxID=7950 RepID=A0A8M1K6S6_CLUHA|nr:uncharacterized protein LOC122128767 [Clupea harengus]
MFDLCNVLPLAILEWDFLNLSLPLSPPSLSIPFPSLLLLPLPLAVSEAQPIDKAAGGPPNAAPPCVHTTISAQTGALVNAPTLNNCHIEGSVFFNSEPGDKDDDDAVLENVQMNHKALMKEKSECIFEGVEKKGNKILLNKIYTDLYITEGESEGVNDEHEVWQLETVSRKPVTQDTAIHCNDIFKPLPEQDGTVRSVMTKGIAGIGKDRVSAKVHSGLGRRGGQ